MKKSDRLYERLRIVLRTESGLSFCKRAGINRSALDSIKRSNNPTLDTLVAIAAAGNVTLQWLATGEGPMRPDEALELPNQTESSFIQVPRYNALLSAGSGALNQSDDILEYVQFSREFFELNIKRRNADGLSLVDVKGDSMEPTISNGDIVMVDHNANNLADGIMAFSLQGEAYVKRILVTLGGIDVLSDNPQYSKRFVSDDDQGNLRIIGKVIWVGHSF